MTVYLEALANLGPRRSGIEGAVLWFSPGEFDAESTRGPRIHVTLGDGARLLDVAASPAVLLTEPPEVLGDLPSNIREHVVQLVVGNRSLLLQYWYGEIDTGDLVERLSDACRVRSGGTGRRPRS
jgi:hypothetical protein